MRLIKPLVIIEDDLSMKMENGLTLAQHMCKKIEVFTRKCYKSEGKMTPESYKEFLPRIFQTFKHEGIAEHRFISVTFITDRGVSHEGVRHRMASYLQESTRYCDYSGKGVTYILPPWVKPCDSDNVADYVSWTSFIRDLKYDDQRYQRYREKGWKPQEARYWLPQGVKTEYAATLNLGSWRNFIRKRTPVQAHPQMRQLAVPLLRYFKEHLPPFFGDLELPTLDYEEAKLIVNPYYEQVKFQEAYSG